jgi:hypothetical protein
VWKAVRGAWAVGLALGVPSAWGDEEYARVARPLVTAYCLECHSTESAEGDVDLERFAGGEELRGATSLWLKVAEKLETGEMPPEDARAAMPLEERRRLQGWVRDFLRAEAQATAGDPGPVVLRRLTNAQYEHTIQELTGLDLGLTREFPADNAAGEGFTNAGAASVMSPTLLDKYLAAARTVAAHAVFLDGGLRFSPGVSRRDWSDEGLGRIRDFYRRFTDESEGAQVNLQGIIFNTNGGGLLPLERYLAALIDEREALKAGTRTVDAVAAERGLSAKYLGIVRDALETDEPESLWLDRMRRVYRTAKPGEAAAVAAVIRPWQQALWKYASVGHIGKVGGPKAWMEPVTPVSDRAEVRLPFPAEADANRTVRLFLTVGDAGDGAEGDVAVWERPRIVTPGRPDLLLRDVRTVVGKLSARRAELLANAAVCLDAAATAGEAPDVKALARDAGVAPENLRAWLDYLGIGQGAPRIEPDSLLTRPIEKAGGYEFIKAWGTINELPAVFANSSDETVRIPGIMKPHGVAMHPTPQSRVVAAWRSPVTDVLTIAGRVRHAHAECGNGVTWRLELRRGGTRLRLAVGVAHGETDVPVGPFGGIAVQEGDLVSLSLGPRDGNHSCDLTAVDLTIEGESRTWDLASDVSGDLEAGNPHADRHGNAAVWYFHTEPEQGASSETVIPTGSLLARWQATRDRDERKRLAAEVQRLVTGPAPADAGSADAALHRQLTSLRGPLLDALRVESAGEGGDDEATIGIDPARFGRLPDGTAIDAASLGVTAPSVVEIELPAELVAGSELVASGTVAAGGSVQFAAGVGAARDVAGSPWVDAPLVAAGGSAARARLEGGLEAVRRLFPPTLCYTRIVPVDEVVTLTLYYREDDLLRRLMLDDAQAAELERLWDELHFVSHDTIALVDVFEQLLEYASQDADPSVFEPMRGSIYGAAEAFRARLLAAEPGQVEAVVRFAAQAYRRPLAEGEAEGLRRLYRTLRDEGIEHDEALRMLVARVLVAPAFLYRVEEAGPGASPSPVGAWALANRLSYFLWASPPDEALARRAESGDLTKPDMLAAEARRMMKDERVRRLAAEFGLQWLHVYDFAALDEKSERHFPEFAALRNAMQEEAVRLVEDLFREDRSILELLDADHTFLNEDLAKFYGIEGVTGPEWRRVDGVREHGRGGILGLAATLAKQSGASRTSPILRGNWISEVIIGEKLPRPPKNVPQLPEDEATEELTVRQLVERHTRDERCASCHRRIDPFGFALESYDAIGRFRERDLANRPIDAATRLPDGSDVDGIEGLRTYLLTVRRDAFVRQFCRKLLGYALGRGVQLSDEPLLDEMVAALAANDQRISAAVETIVRSPQFREIRGRER